MKSHMPRIPPQSARRDWKGKARYSRSSKTFLLPKMTVISVILFFLLSFWGDPPESYKGSGSGGKYSKRADLVFKVVTRIQTAGLLIYRRLV